MGAFLGTYAIDLYSMGVDSPATTSLPSLSTEQKNQIKSLIDQYYSSASLFYYDGTARRQCYAYTTAGEISTTSLTHCMNNDNKYYINCGLFAQMIWMGRNIADFGTTPTTTISTAFNWGYYFDFLLAQNAFGVKKSNGNYYSGNTYESGANTYFISFDNAAAMAFELYSKGYEIPFKQCEVGDLVFYRSDSISDSYNDALEQTSFRYITHVGVVYDIVDGTPIIAESTSSGTYSNGCIGRCGVTTTSYTTSTGITKTLGSLGLTRGAGLSNRIVMVARHPAAFGVEGNVPTAFVVYK